MKQRKRRKQTRQNVIKLRLTGSGPRQVVATLRGIYLPPVKYRDEWVLKG